MFIFKKWNGKYGKESQFIVSNNKKQQSVFVPGKVSETNWVDEDLSNKEPYNSWEDFKNEKVERLEDVVF